MVFSCTMGNMKKVLIWDFNGTIIDDVDYCIDIENRMLRERNMDFISTYEQYRRDFCFPVIDYYYKIGYTFEEESYADISVEFNEMYNAGFDSISLMEGFRELIAQAKEKGYENVILSASRQDYLEEQCRRLGIDFLFDEILGIDNNLGGSKIDMALQWMETADVHPDDCRYIGDTLHDMETAAALGIRNYTLIACGHQSYEILREKTPNVVNSLKEVVL